MNPTQKQYWRSLSQLRGSTEFEQWLHREFQEGATELPSGTSRRDLLKYMGATLGLAGLTACRRPEERILPNAKGIDSLPGGYIPGKPVFYTTAMSVAGQATGLLVEVNDGRPTKVEGNPEHPFSLGAANSWHQASVLGLYDPERSREVRREGVVSSWDEFVRFAERHFEPLQGKGEKLRFLSEAVSSLSYAVVKAHAAKTFPSAKWVEYEPLTSDSQEEALGVGIRPLLHVDKADVIVSLDSDFLGLDSLTVLPLKQFSRRRRLEGANGAEEHQPKAAPMNRLYVAEATYTVTGAAADHRLRVRNSDMPEFATRLAKELGVPGFELNVVSSSQDKANRFAVAAARDLKRAQGKALVVAGPRQSASVHALVHQINQALGAVGETVTYVKCSDRTQTQSAGLKELASDMAAGQVNTLVILGGNPVYNAPADLRFGDNLKKVATTIHLGVEANETAAASLWHLPEAHYLESWGDHRAPDGTVSIQQPMIQPIFNGKTAAEVTALLSGYSAQRPYDIVRNAFQAQYGKGPDEKPWREALLSGTVPNSGYPEAKVEGKKVSAPARAAGLELIFVPSAHTCDGRFANNAWLQEVPDPMSKVVWDNAALMSPATARKLGVYRDYNDRETTTDGDPLITLERSGRTLTLPVLVQPGHADNSITVALGHGRTVCGGVGKDKGFNAYLLRTSDALGYATDAQAKAAGGSHRLVTTQDHHSMEGRPLVREATVAEYRKNPKAIEEMAEVPKLFSLFQEHQYKDGYQWGMAIDLNACVGCNACTVACQAENNIPVVGKEQVARGREMHWIRMDRYFAGAEEDPQVVSQPVPCMQCEMAPCEAVCPVAATAHSPEGLNDMAYNRCVGTRYCSNNCPFKVRRFNFFNWHKELAQPEKEVQKMVFNPDVSVRMRGVMEKCTYCVQRIQEAKIEAKAAGRAQGGAPKKLKDGDIVTACQQTCPADAIVFGDVNDKNSRVSKLKQDERNYAMLAELNVRPRTTYLAKLRNPNPELA